MSKSLKLVLWLVPVVLLALVPWPAEPAQERGLGQVTVAVLRRLERGQLSLLDLVAPKRGLLVISYNCGDNDDPPGPFVRHLCGETALAKEDKALRRELREIWQAGDERGNACRQRPMPHCLFGYASEYAWDSTLWFRPKDGGGFVLDAIDHICGQICIEHDKQRRFTRRQREARADRACSEPSK
jgi:hypothetical protein